MGHTGHELPDGSTLYTRGGTVDVFIVPNGGDMEDDVIPIPQKILRMLVAHDVLMARETELGNMSDDQLLGLKKGQ